MGICASFFCENLLNGIPVRGAITVGEAVVDNESGVYLGLPLSEAAEVEKAQAWLGISLGFSFTKPPYNYMQWPTVMEYNKHWKPESKINFSGLVLDWPRYWRINYPNRSISNTLDGIEKNEDSIDKYMNTQEFYDYSQSDPDWYIGRHTEA